MKEAVKFIQAYQNGYFLISDGSRLKPSQIKGNISVGAQLSADNEVLCNITNENCVGGVCGTGGRE